MNEIVTPDRTPEQLGRRLPLWQRHSGWLKEASKVAAPVLLVGGFCSVAVAYGVAIETDDTEERARKAAQSASAVEAVKQDGFNVPDDAESTNYFPGYMGKRPESIYMRLDVGQCVLNGVGANVEYNPTSSMITDVTSYEYSPSPGLTLVFANSEELQAVVGKNVCAALIQGDQASQ